MTTPTTPTVTEGTAAGQTAAEAVASGAAHGADAAAHGSSGLPQLNPDVFAPQLVWLAITFALLYLLMSRWVIPRIGSVIEARRDRIAKDLAEAERLKTETKQAIEAYEQAIADARGNAHKIAQDTRDRLKSEVDGERTRIERELSQKSAEAEARIAKARGSALAQVGSIAAETTEAIVTQLIGAKVTRGEAQSAVDQSARR